jgi:hypothetical protein
MDSSDHIRFDLEKRLQDARAAYRTNGLDSSVFRNYIRALRNFHDFYAGEKSFAASTEAQSGLTAGHGDYLVAVAHESSRIRLNAASGERRSVPKPCNYLSYFTQGRY